MRTRLIRALGVAAIAGAALALAAPSPATAEAKHGLSAFGDLSYPADFQHFAYTNPDAPKGGTFSLVGWGGVTTFDSLNNYILKGDAAQGLELLFDTLMTRAADEPDAVYGLVAKSAEVAPDGMSVTFTLRPEAKFADGTPLTADDVAFSFETLKTKGHPLFAQTLADVVKVEALDPHTVRYSFKGELTRDLPLTVAELPIFSKAYYAKRDFAETTLDPPLGSGPYVVGDLKQGRTIVYKRNPDYWAKDLPVNRGRWNFDEIRFEYFRDRTAGMEAFKAGTYDFREEFTSKVWATEYDFPAIRAGKVKKEVLADETPSGTQGYFLNTRREQLKDPLVRQALDLAFDFEWTNRNLFYSLYTRTQSYFENSDMKAEGEPSPEEKALLEGLGAPLSPEALGPAYLPAEDRRLRQHSRQAARGRQAARSGWLDHQERQAGERQGRADEARNPEFRAGLRADQRALHQEPPAARHRCVRCAWSIRRNTSGARRASTSTSPPSATSCATRPASSCAAISALTRRRWTDRSISPESLTPPSMRLVERVIAAKNREELTTAARALDRVLRAGHYWVPHWYKASNNIAYWDKFSRPETKPRFDRGILDTWWYDATKAAKLTAAAAEAPGRRGPQRARRVVACRPDLRLAARDRASRLHADQVPSPQVLACSSARRESANMRTFPS